MSAKFKIPLNLRDGPLISPFRYLLTSFTDRSELGLASPNYVNSAITKKSLVSCHGWNDVNAVTVFYYTVSCAIMPRRHDDQRGTRGPLVASFDRIDSSSREWCTHCVCTVPSVSTRHCRECWSVPFLLPHLLDQTVEWCSLPMVRSIVFVFHSMAKQINRLQRLTSHSIMSE